MNECNRCIWFQRHEHSTSEGRCRRLPPVPVVRFQQAWEDSSGETHGGESHVQTQWPNVNEDDWCGEFRNKYLADPPT
jgi:hypothetical protein